MECICLEKIKKRETSLSYLFSCTKGLQVYFQSQTRFTIEYSLENTEISKTIADVPDSVAVIPFLGNVLPIAWLLDAEVRVPEVDQLFFDSVEAVKNGYEKMYPHLSFKGKLSVGRIVDHTSSDRVGCPVAFFSAGVDAWQTLCAHYQEKPLLLTMFGADFNLDNVKGNACCAAYVKQVAEQFGCDFAFFKSNLRFFINEKALNERFQDALGFHWWHRIQHGFGVITHAAPIVYLNNSQTIYFAASYSSKLKAKHPCASDPLIDDHIRFVGARVIHDGYEFTRQDKIYNICHFSKKQNMPIFIHVCWQQFDDMHNCCVCEKCQRTWMGILAEGFNPNDFGFIYEGKKSSDKVLYRLTHTPNLLTKEMWEQILNRFRMNPGVIDVYPELSWTLHYSFDQSDLANGTGFEGINIEIIKDALSYRKDKRRFYRYKLLSQITLGKTKKHYQKKWKKLKEKQEYICKLLK